MNEKLQTCQCREGLPHGQRGHEQECLDALTGGEDGLLSLDVGPDSASAHTDPNGSEEKDQAYEGVTDDTRGPRTVFKFLKVVTGQEANRASLTPSFGEVTGWVPFAEKGEPSTGRDAGVGTGRRRGPRTKSLDEMNTKPRAPKAGTEEDAPPG